MPDVPVDDLSDAVKEEFKHWKVKPGNPKAYDTLGQLTHGYLLGSEAWPFNKKQIQAAFVAALVGFYLAHWTPEYPDDGLLPKTIPGEFKERGAQVPADLVVAALVRVAVGILRQPSLPKPKPAPTVVTRIVVDWYLA